MTLLIGFIEIVPLGTPVALSVSPDIIKTIMVSNIAPGTAPLATKTDQ
jgi:hypothetical protein